MGQKEIGAQRRRMVFHAPFPVLEGASSASGIRPWKMLQSFRDLGYEVFEITGYADSRRKAFSDLQQKMRSGWKPAFVYSEAATIPSSFTEPRHFPLVLNLERKLFGYLHNAGIPIGVFYRDVYWAFEEYRKRVGRPVSAAMRVLYRREIETFNKYVDVLFLPAERMAQFIPDLRVPEVVALPPGADPHDAEKQSHSETGETLRLIYVGSIGGGHYDVSAVVQGVSETVGVELTVCSPEDQVENAQKNLPALGSKNIKVVSESGRALGDLYGESDIASLVVEPQLYRTFAAPMKLYEYFGYGKPVLVSEGTHAAEVVSQYDAGWTVPFDADAVAELLRRLREDPEEVAAKARNAQKAGQQNTWDTRAKTVVSVLTSSARNSDPTHVLVVPSWYPENDGDVHGSFFREQAEALAEAGLKVGVLHLAQNPIYGPTRRGQGQLTLTKEGALGVVRGAVRTYFPMQRALNTRLSRRRLFAAWETYVQQYGKPDVIQAHSLYPGAFHAYELSQKYGIPFVYTEHRTLGHMPARSTVAKSVERKVAEAAQSRHGVSEQHAKHLSARFGGLTWSYTPNLLPQLQGLTPKLADKKGANSFTFGHLSILDPVKRVDLLVEAFAELYADDDSVRLLIGGGGSEREALEAQVEELGIAEAVTFTGPLRREEVPKFHSCIDAFVLTSTTESMGVVQLEALAAGVPVISTRTWGGASVIKDPRDGLLIDIGDKRQLVDAMRKVRGIKETTEDRVARAERCIKRFGSEAFVGRYKKIYAAAIGAGRG